MAEDKKRRSEYEKQKRIVSKLNLTDDIFFSQVMEHKEACGYLISGLLGRKVTVLRHKTQYSIRNIEKHSIVYDVLVKDEDGKLYNVEINTGSGGYHERRLRYYISGIDWSLLDKGRSYKELPELYLLYITKKDPFKLNKNHYEVVQSLKGLNAGYDNGVHIHYFNLEVKDTGNRELTELLEFLANSKAGNAKFGALSDKVNYYKIHEKGVRKMCKIVEDYAKEYFNENVKKYGVEQRNEGKIEGKIEGKLEGKIEMVKNMIELGYKKSEALKCAGLDAKTYNKYLAEQ